MKALVTGGAGFIGSNLVKKLLDKGDDVTVVDNFSVGKLENLSYDFIGRKNYDKLKIVTGNICNLNLMRTLISKNDIVYHLAIECLVRCNENPVLAHEVNSGGTFNICLAAHESNVKMVYVSSSEVYGTCKIVPMSESHPLEPQSIYGLTKLIGEKYVKLFNEYYNLPAVIIRPFNTYGPNHRNDHYSAVITAFIRQLEKGEPLTIEWTGKQLRDFNYVSDTAEGILLLSKLENGEIVNIGSGRSVSINELAMTLMKIYEIENIQDKIIFAEKRKHDVFKLEADNRLAKFYGYEPKVSMEEGLRKYISWWRKNNNDEFHKSLWMNCEHPQEI